MQHASLNGGNWLVVEEPIGWDEASIQLKRDPKWHSIQAEYSLPLKFIGQAATFLYQLGLSQGIDEPVRCRIEHAASQPYAQGYQDQPATRRIPTAQPKAGWQTFLTGRVNLGDGRYTYEDGLALYDANIEQEGNYQQLLSRMDAQVDLRTAKSMDGSSLPTYHYADYQLEILPKPLIEQSIAQYTGAGAYAYQNVPVQNGDFSGAHWLMDPVYNSNSFETDELRGLLPVDYGNQTPGSFGSTLIGITGGGGWPTNNLSPFFQAVGSYENLQLRIRIRFRVTISSPGGLASWAAYPVVRFKKSPEPGQGTGGTRLWQGAPIASDGEPTATVRTETFDLSFVHNTGSVSSLEYFYLHFGFGDYLPAPPLPPIPQNTVLRQGQQVQFFLEAFRVEIRNSNAYRNTLVRGFLANEALARLTEQITDARVTAWSDLFGTDPASPYTAGSQPFAPESGQDGAGYNLFVTNGLLLRGIEQKTDQFGTTVPTPLHMSLEELLDALNACYNIGWELQPRPAGQPVPSLLQGRLEQVLRVEKKSYFYKTGPHVLSLAAIKDYELRVLEREHYTRILAGYEKADVEGVNGLEEFNTKREYQADLQYSSNQLDIRCKFITSGYVIEKVRRIEGNKNASTDTAYDADRFFICTSRRSGTHADGQTYNGPAQSERTESFVSLSTDPNGNLLDGTRSLNLRLAPQRNLKRWAPILWAGQAINTIRQSYYEGNNREGYALLDGTLQDSFENFPAPDRSYQRTYFGPSLRRYYQPLELRFSYPLSWEQYLQLKEDRYSPIQIQDSELANGRWYLRSLEYEPAQGMAKWTLVKAQN